MEVEALEELAPPVVIRQGQVMEESVDPVLFLVQQHSMQGVAVEVKLAEVMLVLAVLVVVEIAP